MENLKHALMTIKNECAKHSACSTCPMYTVDDVCGHNYCSITREGDLPSDWNVEAMVK